MTEMKWLDALIAHALAEDVGEGDHTTLACIPSEAKGNARLLVKEEGIIAGVEVACYLLRYLDRECRTEILIPDGRRVHKDDVVFVAEGKIHTLLKAERLLLNIMQRMSGIASCTAMYVEKIKGTGAVILDTRKTVPGMRMLDKMAVRLGGGQNHRTGLYDMILIKDNHIDFAGGIEKAIEGANQYCASKNKPLKIEIEARSLDDVQRIVRHGHVHRIMFDNFSIEDTKLAVRMVNHRYETESSGNINLDNVRQYAECGIDYISVGALTHQVKSLDLSFKAMA